MKCSNCGKEVPESANVCGYCGTRLKKAEVVKPAAETPKPAPQKAVPETAAPAGGEPAAGKMKLPKWMLPVGLIAVGLTTAALILLVLFKPSSQPQTVRDEPQQEEAPVVKEMELLAGTWKGTAENKMDGSTFEVTFYFPDDCELLSYCGSINIPEFNLSSEVMITSIINDDYEFFVWVNEDLPEDEVPFEYLKYINPNQLKFFSESDDWDEQGTLYKQ